MGNAQPDILVFAPAVLPAGLKDSSMADSQIDDDDAIPRPGQMLRIGKWRLRLPQSRILRTALGIGFIIGGILGFLPVVGFWMIPVGLLILSNDFRPIRRWRRKLVVWAGRSRKDRVG
jgi:hypothetical protein